MSPAVEKSDTMQRCASCGIAEGDDITLKNCTACYLVRYCSVKCQKDHRPKHKKECKKRAAELRDELLFKQPECYLGDCPICCLPLPLDPETYCLNTCCCKQICQGCNQANAKREREGRLLHKCPFCRKLMPSTHEEQFELLMKRIEANDPVAICQMGLEKHKEGDYKAAFEYWTRAAALGDVTAHYNLSCLYGEGRGVEKDEKKERYHLERAAIAGHPEARNNLACMEGQHGRYDRAVKHHIIASKLGDVGSLETLKNLCKDGFVSKEDYVAALRGHKAAVDETKSLQREEAAKLMMQAS